MHVCTCVRAQTHHQGPRAGESEREAATKLAERTTLRNLWKENSEENHLTEGLWERSLNRKTCQRSSPLRKPLPNLIKRPGLDTVPQVE